jgi:hypothetical protein
MQVQTLWSWIGLGLLVILSSGSLKAKELAPKAVPVNVSVYDDAGVGLDTLVKAEEVASSAFQRAGVEISWLNCGVGGKLTGLPECGKAVFPTSLQLRMLKRSRGLTPETFGISYLSAQGEGCYSQIFVEPVEQMHNALGISLPSLLGNVAAHELAHLLLGTNSHSVIGLMRARWGVKELDAVSQGTLLFDRQEARRMAERLIAGGRRNAEVAIAAATKCAAGTGTGARADGVGIASGTD